VLYDPFFKAFLQYKFFFISLGVFICQENTCEIGEYKMEAKGFNDASKNMINICVIHKNFQASHDKISFKLSVRGEKREEQKKEIALKGIQNCATLNAIFNHNISDPSKNFLNN